jgi:hypothetical protein
MKTVIEDSKLLKFIKSTDTSRQLEVILNGVESYLCYDMDPVDYNSFLELFNSSLRSSFNQQARLKMAKKIY